MIVGSLVYAVVVVVVVFATAIVAMRHENSRNQRLADAVGAPDRSRRLALLKEVNRPIEEVVAKAERRAITQWNEEHDSDQQVELPGVAVPVLPPGVSAMWADGSTTPLLTELTPWDQHYGVAGACGDKAITEKGPGHVHTTRGGVSYRCWYGSLGPAPPRGDSISSPPVTERPAPPRPSEAQRLADARERKVKADESRRRAERRAGMVRGRGPAPTVPPAPAPPPPEVTFR